VTSNQSSGQAARQSASVNAAAGSAVSPLDQLSSADIASHVAHLTNLPEVQSVDNHADTFNAQLTTTTAADEAVVAKPQIVSIAQKTQKDIASYTTQAGDTITSIAQKFGVTSDSIRWSNGLTGDTIAAGKQLTIPPISGIVYTVKSGDTLDSLSQHYNANKDAISAFNDAELAGITPGERIVIPDGIQPVTRSSSYVSSSFAWGGFSAVYSNNGYDYGWCTWWAAKRRADIGRPIPSNLGNAVSWAYLAQRAGLQVDGTPTEGAVAWYGSIGGMGHVGFVEQVNPDGSAWISDMNYFGVSQIGGTASAGGWGHTSYHLVEPSGFGSFKFIH
jgi:surface antigen